MIISNFTNSHGRMISFLFALGHSGPGVGGLSHGTLSFFLSWFSQTQPNNLSGW